MRMTVVPRMHYSRPSSGFLAYVHTTPSALQQQQQQTFSVHRPSFPLLSPFLGLGDMGSTLTELCFFFFILLPYRRTGAQDWILVVVQERRIILLQVTLRQAPPEDMPVVAYCVRRYRFFFCTTF